MKPLKLKGIPDVDSYDDLTLSMKVKIGVLYETMLQKNYHKDVKRHHLHLQRKTINELKFYLMNAVDVLGIKIKMDYRENVLAFDQLFKKEHPDGKFFTQMLVEDDSFIGLVRTKKIVQKIIKEVEKNPEQIKKRTEVA